MGQKMDHPFSSSTPLRHTSAFRAVWWAFLTAHFLHSDNLDCLLLAASAPFSFHVATRTPGLKPSSACAPSFPTHWLPLTIFLHFQINVQSTASSSALRFPLHSVDFSTLILHMLSAPWALHAYSSLCPELLPISTCLVKHRSCTGRMAQVLLMECYLSSQSKMIFLILGSCYWNSLN